jgi:hypothetical protein
MNYRYFVVVLALLTFGCGKGSAENTDTPKTKTETQVKVKADTTPAKKAMPQNKAKSAAPTSQKSSPSPKSGAVGKAEVVFDPKNPPAGFTTCHRNHCHRLGGGVASYDQVMKEIGATKSINVPKRVPMPKAPADVAGPGADAEVTGSGIASKVLKAGDGKIKPKVTDTVTVHYTGWTTDGKAFDSSVARGTPATFPLNRVIPGWSEGVQLMTVGEERRFWIPAHLAYEGRPGAPQGMLVFEVELLNIK